MKSDELARLRELHEERENLRRQRNSLPEGREHLALTARIVEINGELLAAVPALLAAAEERDRLSAKLNESNAGWFQVAAHLVETFINGPGNLPNCVLGVVEERDTLRTANRELRAEVERLRGELEAAKRCCDNAETCFGATASVDAKRHHADELPPGWYETNWSPECVRYEHASGCVCKVIDGDWFYWTLDGLRREGVKADPNTRDEAMRRATGDANAREGGGRG